MMRSTSKERNPKENMKKEECEKEAKRRKSALSHSMMRELKSQMFDTPEEISHEADTRCIHIFFGLYQI